MSSEQSQNALKEPSFLATGLCEFDNRDCWHYRYKSWRQELNRSKKSMSPKELLKLLESAEKSIKDNEKLCGVGKHLVQDTLMDMLRESPSEATVASKGLTKFFSRRSPVQVGIDAAHKWFWLLGGTRGVGCDFETLEDWARDDPTETDKVTGQSEATYLTPQQYKARDLSRQNRQKLISERRNAATRASSASEAAPSIPDSFDPGSTKTT